MRRGTGHRARVWLGALLAAVAVIVFAATALAAPGGHRPPDRPGHPGGPGHPGPGGPGGGGGGPDRPIYQDPRAPVDQRVADLLSRMTLEEKVGQTTQINVTYLQGDPANDWDRGPLNEDQLKLVLADHLTGSILSGGGASPAENSPRAWAEMTNTIQRYAIEHSRLRIPIVYGIDAVHGHNNVLGATMFPHEIGLGATFDADLVQELGARTARAVRSTGIQWNFAPVVDTARDLRWGRYYETFGEDPLLTGTLAAADIRGMQGRDLADDDAVAATAKHFTGYSAPDSGHDRTDATISPAELQDVHVPPFGAAVDAGVATVMINSGSVNGVPVHASHELLTGVLRDQLHFQGVAVSDWQDVEYLVTKYHVAANYQEAVALAFNAGMDMAMVPLDVVGYTAALAANVRSGAVSQARLNEAVSRILTLKFRLGLFERPYVDPGRAERVLADPEDHRLAREAASESLVLLENHDRTLPLSPWRTRRVLVTGPSSDSAANQLGGWSIGWQGLTVPGEIPEVTTVKEGVEQIAGGADVSWAAGVPAGDAADDPAAVTAARQEAVTAAEQADAVVVAVGEGPYAEGEGDTETAALPAAQAQLIDALAATGKPVVLVVIAGRPLIMNAQLDEVDAAVMAFLPGTEGGAAIADVLFGRETPGGRLPVSWPRSIGQAPISYDVPAGQPYDPRYPFGYGLTYTPLEVRDVRMPDHVGVDDDVRVDVSLSGGGEGSVLAFVERTGGPATAAARQLVAFARERHGRRGGHVTLEWPVARLAVTQPSGERAVVPGTYRLVVGDQTRTFTVG